jgi:hypothetical protein
MQASDDFGVYKESRHCNSKPNEPTCSRVAGVNNHENRSQERIEERDRVEESDVIDIKVMQQSAKGTSCRHCRF